MSFSEVARGSPARRRAFSKPEGMVSVCLTYFEVAGSRNVAELLLMVQANWADIVDGLPVRHFIFELENHSVLVSLKKLISRFLCFELVFSLQFLAKVSQSLTDLYIHYIRSCQFSGQCVEQPCRFASVRLFVTFKKPFDRADGICSLTRRADGRSRETNGLGDRRKIHSFSLQDNLKAKSTQNRQGCNLQEGAVSIFRQTQRTGGGTAAQETSNITFQDKKT